MRGRLVHYVRAVAQLDDSRSWPTVVVVAKDMVTFTAIVLSAAGVDAMLQHVRGTSDFFDAIRQVADYFLGFLALVYLAEAVVFVLIDVVAAVRRRWVTKLTDGSPGDVLE